MSTEELSPDLSLVYFGAGWDMQLLTNRDYKPFRQFIFIDALPNLTCHNPSQVGYKFAKDHKSFVTEITREALLKGYKLMSDLG